MSTKPRRKPSTSTTVRLPERLKSDVSAALRHYVYALVDPRDDQIFYVGKGQGNRFSAHENEAVRTTGSSAKADRIRSILDAGFTPRVDVIRHGMSDAAEALQVESVVIDALGPGLTNIVTGHQSARAPLDELKIRYAAPTMPIDGPPALLIRLGRWRESREKIERGYFRAGHG